MKISIQSVSILIIISLFISSCQVTPSEKITATPEKKADSAISSCPYLTKDNHNNIVLSWIRKIDTITSVFCFATSRDEGQTFDEAIEIPGSSNAYPHGENLPKIIFKPSGDIIAAWGASNPNPKNPYSGLVYYSQSFDQGRHWTKPLTVTKDTASFDQRYFDLSILPNGEVGMIWLDNRKQSKKEGSGLYYAVTSGRTGFQKERLISEPCCQCCRTILFIDKGKNIHVVYRAIINDSIRDMVHVMSSDNGHSFSSPRRISEDNWVINGCPHTGPAMTENSNGLHFSWFTGGTNAGVYYNHLLNDEHSFSLRDTVGGKSAKHCQITALPGNNHLVTVWNESFQQGNDVSSRIGIEVRNENGKKMNKTYVTAEGSHSSFPVIYPVSSNKVLIAYTESMNNHDFVMYKKVTVH